MGLRASHTFPGSGMGLRGSHTGFGSPQCISIFAAVTGSRNVFTWIPGGWDEDGMRMGWGWDVHMIHEAHMIDDPADPALSHPNPIPLEP